MTNNNHKKQFAAAYTVYMIAGSYFHKCICKNAFKEKRLFLDYAETSQDKKVNMENKVLQKMERLDPIFLDEIKNMMCEVHLLPKGAEYWVEFRTGGFEFLRGKIRENGEVELVVV